MALNIVKHDASFNMVDSLAPTIRKAFNGSKIAKSYASGRKKTTYIVKGGGWCHRNGKRVKVNLLSRNENNGSGILIFDNEWTTVKPLNSGHLRVLKNLSVIKRCALLGGSVTKIVTFRTKHFVRYSRHVRYLRCPLLGGFTVFHFEKILIFLEKIFLFCFLVFCLLIWNFLFYS